MSEPGEEISSEGELGSSPPTVNATGLMQNPQLLAAVQDGLSRLVGQSSGYVESAQSYGVCCRAQCVSCISLPKCVKRRIKALKNIQAECCKIEGKFYEEVHALECKYAEKFRPLYEKRKNIANGHIEPTDKECEWPSDDELEENEEKEEKEEKDKAEVDQLSEEMTNKVTVNDDKQEMEVLSEDTKGIPEFWLTSMKNVDMIAEMIQEHDEPILKHLTELKVVFVGPDSTVENSQYPLPTPMGFVLEFHFSPNPFFTNTILTKSYKMKCEPDEDDPFSFEGPEIVHTSGCKIDWKKGKNITQKIVKKKQRHKGRGQTRFINKTVKNDSFFNFFSPPEVTEDDEDMDEDTEALLAADFEIGHFFRERLIPKAVLYFTGEAGDDDFDEEDEDEDAEGEHDEDDDDDPDYNPPPPGENPQECKQQ